MNQPPRLGVLFALDGAGFIVLAVASLRFSWWRAPTAALLVATILAYLAVVASAREAVDDLGVATKLIERSSFASERAHLNSHRKRENA